MNVEKRTEFQIPPQTGGRILHGVPSDYTFLLPFDNLVPILCMISQEMLEVSRVFVLILRGRISGVGIHTIL